jgi:two-component system OmpR family sensor kinase
MTGAVVTGVMHLSAASSGQGWKVEQRRLETFFGAQFADVWDDPGRRDALARSMNQDLDVDLTLGDGMGAVLSTAGEHCARPWLDVPVRRKGMLLGSVKICAQRHAPFSGRRVGFALLLAGALIWGASGKIARRLSRPLWTLAQAARELGAGNLSARVALRRHEPGEIGLLTEAFNDMAARIEQQIADQRELLAGVSHELRTPLARIRILIELLRDGAGPERLEEIEREIIEIDSLVGELLASSRLDFAALVRKPLDGAELARRALVRAGLSEASLELDGDTHLEGDPTLVARALANLIDNAKKYGGGLVTLRVAQRDRVVAFEADDAGSGFTGDSVKHAFQAFAPVSEGQSRDHGSLGLGLALVKRIAEAHGGRAYVGDRPGGGARVGIELASKSAA